ncbi:MAG: hypothetical protein OCC46_11815 [Pseudodesulfovibrio sp.]
MSRELTSDNLRRSFLGAYVVSVTLIVVIKFLSLGTILSIIAPTLIMLFYFRTFSGALNKESYQEQFADSFYSLGFLLTLTALVITFFPFFLGDGSISMEDTLGNFGVALVTTLVGLTGRIYLVSFSRDLEQLQKETVCQLERDARSFKEEMGASIAVMREFNAELDKTTKKTVEDFGASLAGAGDEITELVQGTMKTAFAPLSKTFADLSKEVEQATSSFGSDLDGAFKQCVDSVNAVQLAPDILGDALKPALMGFEQVVKDIEENVRATSASLAQSSGTLDTATSSFSTSVNTMDVNLVRSMEKLVTDLDNLEIDPAVFTRMLEQAFQEFEVAVSMVAKQTRAHGAVLEQSANAVENALPAYDNLATNVQGVIELGKGLDEVMGKISTVSGMYEVVAQDIGLLGQKTQAYVSAVDESVTIHRQKNQDLIHEHKGIKEVRASLEEDYKKTHEAIRHLGDTFTGIAQFVTHKLSTEEA